MNDLKNSCPEGLEERLLEEMETIQNELEEKEEIILQQQIQLEDSLRLIERLTKENRAENVEALKKDLQNTRKILNAKIRERDEANIMIGSLRSKLKEAVKEIEYVKTHQKTVEVPVKVPELYEKCESCDRTAYLRSRGVYEKRKRKLEKEYRRMMQEIEGSLLGLLLYSVMITLFSAVRSQAFAQDAGRFFQIMWRGLSWLVGGILGVGRSVAGISIYISHPIVSKILYGILEWGTAILLTSGITVVLVWIFYEGVKAYGECFGDWISAVIWIASGAVLVFFGDWIRKAVPVNLVLLLLGVHGIYMGLRWYLHKKTEG